MKYAACLVAIAVCAAPANAENITKEFERAWSERAIRYDQQYADAEIQKNKAEADLANFQADSGKDANAPVATLVKAAEAFAYTGGRRAAIKDFRAFFANKPSGARTNIWFQEASDTLTRMKSQANDKFEALRNHPFDKDYFPLYLQTIAFAQTLSGASDEMKLIAENVDTYFAEKNERDRASRGRWAAFFGGIGNSMQQLSAPPVNRLSTTNCHTIGANTRCTTF